MNLLKNLLEQLLVWKFISFIMLLIVVVWIPMVDTDFVRDTAWFSSDAELETLELTSGVRAAFSALAAAATLLVNLIPVRPDQRGAASVNLLVQFLAVGAAGLAGWYWLSGETGDNPLPYIFPMVILGAIVGLILIFRAFWVFSSDVFNKGTEDNDHSEESG